MVRRLLFALCLCLWPVLAPASAQAQDDAIEGSWDFRIDGVTIFRFEISRAGAQEWRGTWSRPDSFATDGYAFARLRGGVEKVTSMTGIAFDGKVELSFDDPRPNAVPDIFRFDLLDSSHVRMTYVGTDLAPFDMVRAEPGDPIGTWDVRAVYARSRPALAEEAETPGQTSPTSRGAGGDAVVVAGSPAETVEQATPEPVTAGPVANEEASEPPSVPGAQDEAPPRRRVGADFLDGL